MSYRATLEHLVYLDNFRNVDLFQQGYFYLKINLYHEFTEEKILFVITFVINCYRKIMLLPYPHKKWFLMLKWAGHSSLSKRVIMLKANNHFTV